MSDRLLDAAEQEQLLGWARETLQTHLTDGSIPEIDAERFSSTLSERGGAFVTLRLGEQPRGCIGTFEATAPLLEVVRDMAISAATRDHRFRSVAKGELSLIHVEISVLTPRREAADPLAELEVGRHGIYISRGWRRGVLLPQVATQYGWGPEEFLEHTCIKAGLPTDAWHQDDTKVELFSAQVFGEAEGEVCA